MALSRVALEAKVEEVIQHMDHVSDHPDENSHWTRFCDDFYPTLHELSSDEMESAIRCIDGLLFNNTITLASDGSTYPIVHHQHADNDWKLSNLKDLGDSGLETDGSITITICNENHSPITAFKILETLIHEMCHAAIMRFTGNEDENHGRSWQLLTMTAEETLEQLLGDVEVSLGRRWGALGDIKDELLPCPHLDEEDVELFFGHYPEEEKEEVRCKCEVVSQEAGSEE